MSHDFQERVRRGLQSSRPAEHPAADLLNAYAEHALTPSEEQQVVQHLAVCEDCRDIVYLASGAAEGPAAAAPVQAAASPRVRWWTWAIPVAAVLAVASTMLLVEPNRLKRPAAPSQVALQSAPAPAPQTEASPAAPETPSQPSTAAPARAVSKHKDALAAPAVTAPAAPSALNRREMAAEEAAAKNEPAKPSENSRDALAYGSAGAAAKTAPAPESHQTTVEVAAEDKEVEVPTTAMTLDATQQQVAVQSAPVQTNRLAKQQSSAVAATESSPAAHGMMPQAYSRNVAAPRTWTVTKNGTLQHLVGGVWSEAGNAPKAHFLAVSAVDADVWAGGTRLALYHSGDGGMHWEAQKVPAQSTENIVKIEFKTALDGVLRTNSGGIFATHDGGKTWIGVVPPSP